MKTLTNFSHEQYAVIEVRQSSGGVERVVISYHDKQVLRGFLTARSIVATGFSSADEAMKSSSFTAGIRQSRWLSTLGRGFNAPTGSARFNARTGSDYLRHLKTQSGSRLRCPVEGLKAMSNVVLFAVYKIQTQLLQALRRLEPAVQ